MYPPTGVRAIIFKGPDEQQHSKQQYRNVLSVSAMAGSYNCLNIARNLSCTFKLIESELNYPQHRKSIQIDGPNNSEWHLGVQLFIGLR